MQKQTKDGECINTKACNLARSDDHNMRKGKITNSNIRLDLTGNNDYWLDPNIPNLSGYDKRIREDFFAQERVKDNGGIQSRYHRRMPKKGPTKASPIRESILRLPSNERSTLSIVLSFIKIIQEKYGWRAIRYYIHRDEYYDDPDRQITYPNCHVHIVWDSYDWMKHQSIRLSKKEYREMQDIAAQVTGMPRGEDARLTKKKHLDSPAFKVKMERVRAERLERENNALEQSLVERKEYSEKELVLEFGMYSRIGRELTQMFDSFFQMGLSKVSPAIERGRPVRDALYQASGEQMDESVPHGEKEQRISELRELIDSMLLILNDIYQRIKKFSQSVKNAGYKAMLQRKITSIFVPNEEEQELTTNEELQKEKTKIQEELSRMQTKYDYACRMAREGGFEIDYNKIRERIQQQLRAESIRATASDVENLMKGNTIKARVGERGFVFEIRAAALMRGLEMRVFDTLTVKKNHWSSTIREAEQVHGKLMEMILSEKNTRILNKKPFASTKNTKKS